MNIKTISENSKRGTRQIVCHVEENGIVRSYTRHLRHGKGYAVGSQGKQIQEMYTALNALFGMHGKTLRLPTPETTMIDYTHSNEGWYREQVNAKIQHYRSLAALYRDEIDKWYEEQERKAAEKVKAQKAA